MQDESTVLEALASMFDDGWISEVLYEVKSGKEATVHCCRGGDRAAEALHCDAPHLAAKVHRDHRTRRFKNDGVYQAGRPQHVRPTRVQRAIRDRSNFGREAHAYLWLDHEWTVMNRLAAGHLDVPKPLAANDRAILLPFLGDEAGPAPMLNDVSLSKKDAARVADRILWNVEAMLDLHVVHGDLSPYNVLYCKGKATIIDFPQAIDPRMNPAALNLLSRDVQNICRWAAKSGVRRDDGSIVSNLWRRFRLGELG